MLQSHQWYIYWPYKPTRSWDFTLWSGLHLTSLDRISIYGMWLSDDMLLTLSLPDIVPLTIQTLIHNCYPKDLQHVRDTFLRQKWSSNGTGKYLLAGISQLRKSSLRQHTVFCDDLKPRSHFKQKWFLDTSWG